MKLIKGSRSSTFNIFKNVITIIITLYKAKEIIIIEVYEVTFIDFTAVYWATIF